MRISKQHRIAHLAAHSVKGIVAHQLNILDTALHLLVQLVMLRMQGCQLRLRFVQLVQRCGQHLINIGFLTLGKEVIFFLQSTHFAARRDEQHQHNKKQHNYSQQNHAKNGKMLTYHNIQLIHK